MSPQEFYIRSASETEARGPFNLDQIISLAEAGQVTLETLYYDAANEQWVAVGDNPDVRASVFPEKKKLTVKKDVKVVTLNKESDSSAPITVTDMLAAAEGRTHETRDRADPEIAMAKAAKMGMWAAIGALLLATAGEVAPSIDLVMTMDPSQMVTQPLILLGTLDIVIALLLMLGATALYPFVRFRAALGVGFVGFIYWSQGQHLPVIAVAVGSLGLYLCTVFIRFLPVVLSAGLALAGMGAFAWLALTN
jgi:hypothetical protein